MRLGGECYEPPLRPEAQAWGAYVAENPMACDVVTRRSRDRSEGPVYEDLDPRGPGLLGGLVQHEGLYKQGNFYNR